MGDPQGGGQDSWAGGQVGLMCPRSFPLCPPVPPDDAQADARVTDALADGAQDLIPHGAPALCSWVTSMVHDHLPFSSLTSVPSTISMSPSLHPVHLDHLLLPAIPMTQVHVLSMTPILCVDPILILVPAPTVISMPSLLSPPPSPASPPSSALSPTLSCPLTPVPVTPLALSPSRPGTLTTLLTLSPPLTPHVSVTLHATVTPLT